MAVGSSSCTCSLVASSLALCLIRVFSPPIIFVSHVASNDPSTSTTSGCELDQTDRGQPASLDNTGLAHPTNAVKDGAHISFGRIRKLMSRLKISAISYLNTAPLMWDFEHGEAGADFDISYTIPSACAEALRVGAADIGIIPAAAYATVPDLVIIPDVAIASRHAVGSILLVSKMPHNMPVESWSKEQWSKQVSKVALDTSSMTSAALAKLLLAKWLGGARDYKPMAPDLDAMLDECDAALLIGDPALQVDRTRYFTLDLAEEWKARTGKSFVFAFWAIRKQALAGRDGASIVRIFRKSRDRGLLSKNLETIAQGWAPRSHLPDP